MRYGLIIVMIMMALAFQPSQTAQAQNDSIPSLTTAEKVYGLSLFWKEVSYNFAFFHQVPNLDWDSAYQAFIPRVIATESTYDYYRELQRFCALLKDGHTSISFPRGVQDHLTYPKTLQAEIDHRMFIRNVDSGLAAVLPIGTEILSIDGRQAADFVQNDVMPYISTSADQILWDRGIREALRGPRGTEVELAARRPDGTDTTVSLVRDREGVRWYRGFPERPLIQLQWLDDHIAHIQLNSFNDPAIVPEFEALLPELYESKGILIDLRNNGGGNTSNGTGILQHFTTDTLWGSVWSTRHHIAAYKAWGRWDYQQREESERVDHFLGKAWFGFDTMLVVPDPGRKIEAPVVVLFGRNTASAAEDFLIFADPLEQFTYVGEPSFGSTGQPLVVDDFPGGGFVRICTKRDTYPDGRDFVGYGVQPDILVKPALEALIDGSDPVLARGIEVLKEKLD